MPRGIVHTHVVVGEALSSPYQSTKQRVSEIQATFGREPTFHRTGQQQIDQPSVVSGRLLLEQVLPGFETLDVERLPRQDAILLPQLGRKNNLALAGKNGLHIGKIASYLADGKPFSESVQA